MKTSKNEKVENFLDKIQMIDGEAFHTLTALRKIIFKNYPKTEERFMYGGIMFSLEAEYFAGVFVRKNHISLEFSKGFLMADPGHFLEGGGKYRRHLKIRSGAEVLSKHVDLFVKQAL